ncbi:PDE2 3' [Candida maltosa Xu316]
MAEILSLIDININLPNIKTTYQKFNTFTHLITYLFQKTNKEYDSNIPIYVILPNNTSPSSTTSINSTTTSSSSLENLSFNNKSLILYFFFTHLNLSTFDQNLDQSILQSNINESSHLLTNRISRVGNWTGTLHFNYNRHNNDCDIPSLFNTQSKIAGVIPTMTYILNCNATRSTNATTQLIYLQKTLTESINYLDLLKDNSPKRLSQLCYAVGHWSFPAHELSNDDLIYCVYLMLNYAINNLKSSSSLDPNELLAFVFFVRDTYKNGNPFHNFRHAVDVLQACFHFLIRLGSLPKFKQYIEDPNVDYNFETYDESLIELQPLDDNDNPRLNPIQALGLLVAALGHDVGHPGTTNDFMIKYHAPSALLFNDRSVLESYHASVFVNKILAICWPSLLSTKIESKSELTVRSLIISSILATDMGEHNEYVNRLKSFKTNNEILNHDNTVKLISALLIKCADISNVTRPLRVSSQWAMVLSREFAEVELLKSIIDKTKEIDFTKEITYDHVPHDLHDILTINPNLQNGQIFFINLFAENLFNNIAELLPQLQYTCDIITENKDFWIARTKK